MSLLESPSSAASPSPSLVPPPTPVSISSPHPPSPSPRAEGASPASAIATPPPAKKKPDFEIKELPSIQLATDRGKTRLYDNLADLYSLIIAIEHLETAWTRDSISNSVYQKNCTKLLAQFKTLQEAVADVVPDVERFMRDYHMNCKAAANRIKTGVPATLLHGGGEDNKGQMLIVFHTVQAFITTMDQLKLEMKAVDEIHPNLTELMDSINKVTSLPPDHESKTKVKDWLLRLSARRAHDELSVDEVRQMSFDLDVAYNAFHKWVQLSEAKGKPR